ncbi:hypothetical protein TrCOL_g8235 [Triparma columacea]|nr:hypothetical protein TrCOL_g8235 [Triparma columacea]
MGSKGAYIIRLLMVGDSACGKTSLVLRFDQDIFSSKFVTTIGVDYRDKLVNVDGVSLRLQLWDTAGQERFRSLTSNFFGRADGFVLAYDCTSRSSFLHVASWMRDINSRAPPDVDVVLCGNKIDVEDKREVSYEEGLNLAEEFGICFFEVSAKTGSNVNAMFMSLANSIKNSRLVPLNSFSGGSGGGNDGERGGGVGLAGGNGGGSKDHNGERAKQEDVFGFRILKNGGRGEDGEEREATSLDKCCG